MGLTSSSTGSTLLNNSFDDLKNKCDYTIAFAGNPNVGKSTIFNALTGMHQHTGNWSGKTISNAHGIYNYNDKNFLLVDIPGTYSLMSNSPEEEIARDYICFNKPNVTVIVLDATCLERNLNLVYQTMEITKNIIVCVNLLDEAQKKGISVNLKTLEYFLGVPVVGTTAKKKKTLNSLLECIYNLCENKITSNPELIKYEPIIENNIKELYNEVDKITPNKYKYLNKWICFKLLDNNNEIISSIEKNLNINLCSENLLDIKNMVVNKFKKHDINPLNFNEHITSSIIKKAEKVADITCNYKSKDYNKRNLKIDKLLTSKKTGIPIMLLFFSLIFWLTIVGANYPSKMLSNFFIYIQYKIEYLFEILNLSTFIKSLLIDGLYKTVTWIVSVMLPPMAIFFPLFTLLEDLGYLPRIAFNLDNSFKKAGTSGKQALTMCMGFGCNAAGVVGCRIIDSPRERIISMVTNAFVPCNGRFPFLITLSTIFIGNYFNTKYSSIITTLCVILVILLGVLLTLIISKVLSKTLLKGSSSSFILELPPYRKPQIGKTLIKSFFDRTLFVLGRSIIIAAPMGIIIWLLANTEIFNNNLLFYLANFLDPFAKCIGLDGYILTAFILGIPANEIVLPILLMSYLSSSSLMNIDNTMQIAEILYQNSWTILTGINTIIFTLLHFPCSTTLISIQKESGSIKWAILAFILPTICGIIICYFTTLLYNI